MIKVHFWDLYPVKMSMGSSINDVNPKGKRSMFDKKDNLGWFSRKSWDVKGRKGVNKIKNWVKVIYG